MCGKKCRANIGLWKHLQTHRQQEKVGASSELRGTSLENVSTDTIKSVMVSNKSVGWPEATGYVAKVTRCESGQLDLIKKKSLESSGLCATDNMELSFAESVLEKKHDHARSASMCAIC